MGFESSEHRQILNTSIERTYQRVGSLATNGLIESQISYKKLEKTSIFTQILWLLWRNSLGLVRDPFSLRIQIGQNFVNHNYKNIK